MKYRRQKRRVIAVFLDNDTEEFTQFISIKKNSKNMPEVCIKRKIA